MFNLQLRTLGKGALEAFVAGALIGVASVWTQPTDILLTQAGLASLGMTTLKWGLFYLFAWARTTAGVEKQ